MMQNERGLRRKTDFYALCQHNGDGWSISGRSTCTIPITRRKLRSMRHVARGLTLRCGRAKCGRDRRARVAGYAMSIQRQNAWSRRQIISARIRSRTPHGRQHPRAFFQSLMSRRDIQIFRRRTHVVAACLGNQNRQRVMAGSREIHARLPGSAKDYLTVNRISSHASACRCEREASIGSHIASGH